MRAAAATRALSVSGRPKMLRELPRPIYVSHRIGGSNGYGPYPENTAESMEFLLADGGLAMNYDGLSITSDGVIVNEHDATVDRTKNGTGTISAMTLAAYKALKQMPSLSWGPGFPDNTWATHTFDEMVAQLGARAVHHPECNVVGQGAFYANCYVSRGLNDYVQLETANPVIASTLVAAGLPTMFILTDGTAVATVQSQWAAANGPVGLNYYQSSPPGGTIDGYIQALVTAGYKVQVFSINRKSDAAAAIASAAAAGGVLDAVISNDPIYHDTRIWKARTSDTFALGRYGHGMVGGSGGSIPRLGFYGTNRAGFGNGGNWSAIQFFLHGEISPLPTTFTIDSMWTWDAIPSGATSYMQGAFCTQSDLAYGVSGTSRQNGYTGRLNQNGLLTLNKNSANGSTQVQLGSTVGTATISAPQQLTAGLTSGVPVTSLAVAAIPTALAATVRLAMPDGGVATLSASATAGATSLSIASYTPSANIPSGSFLPQTVPVRIQVTSTQVIFKRLDTNDTVTASDTTWRNGWVFWGKAGSGPSTFTDGVINGTTTLTSATAAFSYATDIGKQVVGTGIPANAYVVAVNSATSVTLSAAATASASGLSFTIARPGVNATFSQVKVT